MENTLLDANSFDTWTKELPSYKEGFNELRKRQLKEYPLDTDNPHEFAKYVWQFIYDNEEEIERIVRTVEEILQQL